MADKELKPKSFRLDDETADKFKEIAASIGGNQQETLSKLIEAYEFQSGKAVLTDKKGDIEQFEQYVNALTRMYMGSLEDNQNVSETIRTEFDAQLKSKDTTIQDLQAQLVTSKQLKDTATEQAKAYAKENADLQATIDRMNATLTDKDDLNKALTDSCKDLKEKVEEMEADVKQSKMIKKELEDLQKEYDVLKASSDALRADLSDFKAKHDKIIAEMEKHENEAVESVRKQQKLECDRELLETERKYQEQIDKLKADKQTEVDAYQKKYLELLEQLKDR